MPISWFFRKINFARLKLYQEVVPEKDDEVSRISGIDACPEHSKTTASERQLRYCFSIKHHDGRKTAAQWVPDLSRDDEFAIFDEADRHEISDEDGNLFGLRRDAESGLQDLGTRGEQIAKFWENHAGQPWHGYPLYPLLGRDAPQNRRNKPIPKSVLLNMQNERLLDRIQARRLQRGDRA